MIIVYWLFILLCSASTADLAVKEKTTLVVKQNYNGPHEGWFHVNVYQGSPVASIDKITWCSTIFVPRVGEVPRDIKDCHASALLHAQIYPNGDPTLYRINMENGGTIEISPETVGGFWLNRPADLVIHGTLTDGRRLEQIVRLRPNPNEGEEIIEDKAAIPSLVSPSVKPAPLEPASMEAEHVEAEHVEAEHVEAASFGEKANPAKASEISVTNIYAIVGGIGLLVMIFTIGMAVARRKTVRSMSRQSSAASEKYASTTVYAFENDDLSNVKKQEMDLLDALEQDNDDSALKRRRKAENLEILTKMGKGATPSFYANI